MWESVAWIIRTQTIANNATSVSKLPVETINVQCGDRNNQTYPAGRTKNKQDFRNSLVLSGCFLCKRRQTRKLDLQAVARSKNGMKKGQNKTIGNGR